MHITHTDKHPSEETRKKMSDSNKGKHVVSEETRKRLSKSLKGRYVWNNGVPMSKESKLKLSRSLKIRLQNMYWWNNGVVNTRAKKCPEGFVRGKLKRSI